MTRPPAGQGPPAAPIIALYLAFLVFFLLIGLGIVKCARSEPALVVVEWLETPSLRDYLDEARESPHGEYALTLNRMLQAAAAEDSLAWLKVRLDVPAGESWQVTGPAPVLLHFLRHGVPVELAASALFIARDRKLDAWQDTRRGAATVRASERGSHYPALVACPKALFRSKEIRVSLNPDRWRSLP